MGSGSNYVPQKVVGDSDGNMSLVKDGDVDPHSTEEIETDRRQLDERKMVIDGGRKDTRGIWKQRTV